MPGKVITIIEKDSNQRLDNFLSTAFPKHTRSYFTKHIKSGEIRVNSQQVKPGYILQINDNVEIDIQKQVSNLQPANIALNILFEDDQLMIINKPAGITVHPGKGTAGDTLVNALLFHTQNLALQGQSERPGIVHRLDKYTSGLLIIAKNDETHVDLRKQFDDKTIKRTYWALVWGVPKEHSGRIETHIDRSKKDPTKMAVAKTGKNAITHWEIIKEYNYFSLLKLNLETGRTHQIRLHMNWMGNPIVGDPDYNGRETQLARLPENLRKRGQHLLKLLSKQFLHAKILEFIHPVTKEKMLFESELPDNLKNTLDKLPDLMLLN